VRGCAAAAVRARTARDCTAEVAAQPQSAESELSPRAAEEDERAAPSQRRQWQARRAQHAKLPTNTYVVGRLAVSVARESAVSHAFCSVP